MRVACPAAKQQPRFEVSIAIVGYLVLLALLVDLFARHLAQR